MEEKKYADKYDYINEWKRKNRRRVVCEMTKEYYSDVYLPYIKANGMSNNEFITKCVDYCIKNKIKF